jgi:hypothetical protein
MPDSSSEYFVVKPKSARLPDDLPAEFVGPSGLFVLYCPDQRTTPRQQWEKLVHDYGDLLKFVSPVMLDDKGQQMLPTGKIIVQFHTTPTLRDLKQFEERYDLHDAKVNEFANNQFSFDATDLRIYLPDLVAELQADGEIKLAAPETFAKYSRR